MKTYTVKDHDFVSPFQAKSDDEAAEKALKILGFDWTEAEKMVKQYGNLGTLNKLGYELTIF